MQKFISGRVYDSRNIGYDRDRTGLYSQSVHRQIQQPAPYVGKIPQKVVQEPATHILPISSFTDGRRPRGSIPISTTKRNKKSITFHIQVIPKNVGRPAADIFGIKYFFNIENQHIFYPAPWDLTFIFSCGALYPSSSTSRT